MNEKSIVFNPSKNIIQVKMFFFPYLIPLVKKNYYVAKCQCVKKCRNKCINQ